jgi:hypothetical protein
LLTGRISCTLPAGRKSFQLTRGIYLAGWKGVLPVDKVHVPRWLERCPSSRQGTCTLTAGREPFRLTR